jgi:hypothetical protein
VARRRRRKRASLRVSGSVGTQRCAARANSDDPDRLALAFSGCGGGAMGPTPPIDKRPTCRRKPS